MEVDEALYIRMRKWALKCAHKYKFAIPNKVIARILREFPQLEDEKKELMDEVRKVCTEVNKMKDAEIASELEQSGDETIIFE